MIAVHRTRKFTVLTIFVLILVVLFSQTAHAIPANLVGGISPNTTQISSGGNHPWHNLILSDHGKVQRVLVGMYWPTAGAKQFQINVSQWCDMRPGNNYRSNKRFLAVEINGAVQQRFTGDEACNGTLNNTTFTINNPAANFRDSTMYGAHVVMRWITDSEANACNGGANSCQPIRTYLSNVPEGSRIRFRFNPLGPNARVGLVDSNSSTLGNTNNSIVHTSGNPENLYMPFGLSCSITSPQGNQWVSVYDADNGTAAQSQSLYFYVGTLNANGGVTPLTRSEYRGNGGGSATSLGDIWVNENPNGNRNNVTRPLVSNPNGYPIFTPSNFNNQGGVTTVSIFRMQPQTKYVLMIMNQAAGQFTYVGLPGDALFGSPDFDCINPPTLTPHVGLTGTYEPGGTVDATAWVTKPAGTSDGTSDYRRIFWYEEGTDDTFNNNGPLPDDALVAAGRDVNSNATYNANNTPINPTWTLTIPANTTRKRICTQLSLSNAGPAGATITGNPARRCENIVKRPYFRVENGDVNAAGAMPTACTPGTGTISAFNRGSSTWLGSGTQIAAYSRGLITEFTSGANAGTPPKKLSFANSGGASGSSTYGGSFGSSYCMPDYWANITTTANQAVGNSSANVLTRGDVRIDSNYTVGGSHALNALPVRWVVADDIYISSAVTELDGIYIARRNIYTCSNTTGFSSVPVTGTQLNIQCSTQLKVRGAMIAGNSIKLQRTYGTLALAPNFTAETIEYNPFVWMSVIKSSTPPPVGTSGNKFDFITTLPPVL